MRWPWMAECPCSQGWREGTAGHGWPSVPVAKDGEKGPLAMERAANFVALSYL